MITKRDLIDAIASLDHDLTALAIKVHLLEEAMYGLKNKKGGDKLDRAIRAASQPRDKTGKFSKKK